jgi:hypothetical protein
MEEVFNQMEVFTDYSAWYILICFLIGGVYTFLLYQKKASWNTFSNTFLAVIRFLLVSFICILLLGFFIKKTKNIAEAPTWVIALDNSESLALVNKKTVLDKSVQQIDSLIQTLKNKGYRVDLYDFSQNKVLANLDSLEFNAPATNINKVLHHLEVQYENMNLAGVLLFSDGIYNQGTVPTYQPYNFKLHTLGIGDTLAKKDLTIKSIFNNKISYLGNRFPIVVEVSNTGFVGQNTKISLTKGGKVIESQVLNFTQDNDLQEVTFLTSADKKGVQHYRVVLQQLDGEFTKNNNVRDTYIDVIDSREKILLVASSPHPDVKALRTVIGNHDNYEFDLFIPNTNTVKKGEKYDLIIFHQLPNSQNRAILTELMKQAKAFLFIVGTQTDLQTFNQLNTGVKILASGRQTDKVIPLFNNQFSKFTFESEQKAVFSKYPPLTVPFGNFELSGNTQSILYQGVGQVKTEKPLLTISHQEDKKIAVLLGEGIWQWRLHEFSQNENQVVFDDFFTKIVQYLSTKEDKRKFRLYSTRTDYFDSEVLQFEVEVYNDIYEKISGQKINLQITNEEGQSTSYSFVNNSSDFRYQVKGLPQGVYRYKASTQLDGKTEVSSGQFTIKALQIEASNTQANFDMLRVLAQENKGKFFQMTNFEQLSEKLTSKEPSNILHAYEEFSEIIQQAWLALILILLASVEWFFRKFKGGY